MLPRIDQTCYNNVRILDHPCLPNARRLDEGCLPMIWQFHQHGIAIDKQHFSDLAAKLREKLEVLTDEMDLMLGRPDKKLNYNSGDQVARLVFHDLGLRARTQDGMPKLTKGRAREMVDDEVLMGLKDQHPIVNHILLARQADKLIGTYVEKLPQMVGSDCRLRTTFRHTVARTGRLASEDPNLQNIPTRTADGVEIRKGFVATKDPLGRQCKLASLDLSQIEMVLAGHLSQDPVLLGAFRDGTDIHTITAANCFRLDLNRLMYLWRRSELEEAGFDGGWLDGEKQEWKTFKATKRLPAKTVGFGILYGQTAVGAQGNIVAQGGPYLQVEEVEDIIRGWFGLYNGITLWMEVQYWRAMTFGFVWDMWGRIRRIPEAQSKLKRIRTAGFRQAGNMPITASAQGLIKLDMAQLMPVVEYFQGFSDVRCWPLLQIHDELIFELSPNIADDFCGIAQEIMQTNVVLTAPVKASWGIAERWGDLK